MRREIATHRLSPVALTSALVRPLPLFPCSLPPQSLMAARKPDNQNASWSRSLRDSADDTSDNDDPPDARPLGGRTASTESAAEGSSWSTGADAVDIGLVNEPASLKFVETPFTLAKLRTGARRGGGGATADVQTVTKGQKVRRNAQKLELQDWADLPRVGASPHALRLSSPAKPALPGTTVSKGSKNPAHVAGQTPAGAALNNGVPVPRLAAGSSAPSLPPALVAWRRLVPQSSSPLTRERHPPRHDAVPTLQGLHAATATSDASSALGTALSRELAPHRLPAMY